MGAAGSFFDPQPCNFGNSISFRDVQMILVPFFKIPNRYRVAKEATCPGHPEVHVLSSLLMNLN